MSIYIYIMYIYIYIYIYTHMGAAPRPGSALHHIQGSLHRRCQPGPCLVPSFPEAAFTNCQWRALSCTSRCIGEHFPVVGLGLRREHPGLQYCCQCMRTFNSQSACCNEKPAQAAVSLLAAAKSALPGLGQFLLPGDGAVLRWAGTSASLSKLSSTRWE